MLVVLGLLGALATAAPGASPAAALDGPPLSAVELYGEGGNFNCARFADGTLKCWGRNERGQLGYGDTANRGDAAGEMGDALPPVDLGTGRTMVGGAAGDQHMCALLDNGGLKCWGSNQNGALGLGDTANRGDAAGEMGGALPTVDLGTGRTATAVAGGLVFTCALLDNGSVKCWGLNIYGQLGLGDTASRGDAAGEMGDALPAVDLGPGRTATAVAVGSTHACAILDNGSVKCWGRNNIGQLGLGDTANRGDAAGEMGAALPAVPLGTGRTAVALALGSDHTCALLDDHSLKCWGNANQGQIGSGNLFSKGDDPGEMGDALPAVALGTGRHAVEIDAGTYFTCARLDDATVKCWGNDPYGQLGHGRSPSNWGNQDWHMGDNLPTVSLGTGRTAVGVMAGNEHTCARLDDGTAKCWGRNNYGQLGLGNTVNRGSAPSDMGDALPVVDLGHLPALPAMTVGLTADEPTVPAGTPIHFHVTLTNTGNVALTGVTVSDANAPGCAGPQADLAVGASRTVDCTYTPTVDDIGTRSNTAIGDAAEVEPVTSSTVDVSVTIPAGQGVLKGRVTAQIFGNPVAGVLVAGLAPSDFSVVGLDLTAGDGTYAMLVPAGSVMVYLADPANGHIPRFHATSPTAVGDGATVVVNEQLNRALGGIEGRITDATSGDGVPTGVALTSNPVTGQMSIGATTDGFGFYVIRNLRSVGYLVTLLDLAGAHTPRYYNGAPTPATASTVNVVGGALQVIGTSALPAQAAPGATAHLNGVVTGAGGGAMENVAVVALNAGDFTFEAGDLTDGQGAYDIGVDPGSYVVGFADTTGSAGFEWNQDQPGSGLGSATPVPAAVGADGVVNASLASNRGTIAGTITEDGSGDPLADMWVFAIDSTGSVVGVAKTAVDGTYTIANVPVGGVRVRVIDIGGAHTPEYYDDQAGPGAGTDYPSATLVTITGGATATIDAGLGGAGPG